jgi:hypothetical protein
VLDLVAEFGLDLFTITASGLTRGRRSEDRHVPSHRILLNCPVDVWRFRLDAIPCQHAGGSGATSNPCQKPSALKTAPYSVSRHTPRFLHAIARYSHITAVCNPSGIGTCSIMTRNTWSRRVSTSSAWNWRGPRLTEVLPVHSSFSH